LSAGNFIHRPGGRRHPLATRANEILLISFLNCKTEKSAVKFSNALKKTEEKQLFLHAFEFATQTFCASLYLNRTSFCLPGPIGGIRCGHNLLSLQ
jgi:hypothetical protein